MSDSIDWNDIHVKQGLDAASSLIDEKLKAANDQPAQISPEAVALATNQNLEPFNLAIFSMHGRSEKMEERMLADKYILSRIAILGQATAIYAKPNTGKTLLTLYLIIEAIKSSDINAADVFYINADDCYRGLVTKLKIAEQYGFHMLSPGQMGFKSEDLVEYLDIMNRQDTATGKVIILDTLKKFTNPMDKRVASEYMRTVREFVARGGTVIMLAHTNKNRGDDGKVVYGGTSDIVDDVDCCYTLDEMTGADGFKHVIFENIKSRGDVCQEAAYRYPVTEGIGYLDLLQSIEPLAENAAAIVKAETALNERLARNKDAITAILDAITTGHSLKTDIITTACRESGLTRAALVKVLNQHGGSDYQAGHRWQETKGDKNQKYYSILNNCPGG